MSADCGEGRLSALPEIGTGLTFPVTDTGSDGSPSSGVASFTIDISTEGGP
jgi:hypothetical protein